MLTEKHRLIAESVDKIVERTVQPIAFETDQSDAFPDAALKALGEAGYLGVLLPEPHGTGGDLLAYALLVERLAAVSPSVAWAVVVHVSASAAIASTGTDEQQAKYLSALAAGERLASFAFTEANAGADFFAIDSLARTNDDGYTVNGSKAFISLAQCADVFVTLLALERDGERAGPTMFLVDRDREGFSVGGSLRGMGVRGIGWGDLVFDDYPLTGADLLGDEGKGTRVVFSMTGPYLLGAAAMGLGIAHGAYDSARRHLGERTVKDAPIGNHQALQFRVADLSAKVEAVRALVYRACFDTEPQSLLPFQAKLFATETALDVTRAAVQLHGANGYANGSLIERLARDAYALTLHFENNDFLRSFVGRTLMQS